MAQENFTGAEATPPVAGQEQVQGNGQIQEPAAQQVPVAAVEDERGKRQKLEVENEIMRRKLEIFEQAQVQQPQVPQGLGPDEIPLVKDVHKMVKDEVGKLSEENKQTRQLLYAQAFAAQHSDYQDIFQLGVEVAKSEGILDEVMKKENAASIFYNFGKAHPSFKQGVTQAVAEKINQNLNSQRTLSDVGGGGAPSISKDWTTASHDEIEKKKQAMRFKR